MLEETVVIASSVGLHARPATLLAKAASAAKQRGVKVMIRRADKDGFVNAASTLSILTLGVKHGEQVIVQCDGDDERAVLTEVVELLSQDHDTQDVTKA